MTSKPGSIWNLHGTLDALIKLQGSGLSRGQMARKLSAEFHTEISRSAVCGKLHREGFPAPKMPTRAVDQVKVNAAPVVSTHLLSVRPPPPLQSYEPQPMGDIATGCRWLHGDARERNFCGADKWAGGSWCPYHHAICLAPDGKSKPQKPRNFHKFMPWRAA